MSGMNASSAGMQQKYFDDETGFWYKEDYLGTEGLSEYAATLLLKDCGIPHAEYEVCEFYLGKRKVTGCRSKDFLKEGEILKTTFSLFKEFRGIDIAAKIAGCSVIDKVKFFVDGIVDITGIENFGNYMSDILQFDAITKNDDRHFRNICVITNDGVHFKPAPIFDNGGAFLADKYTYGDCYSGNELYRTLNMVQAKPFSTDFDEQLEACEKIYGASSLKLARIKESDFLPVRKLYSEADIARVYAIIKEAERKYSFAFRQ